MRLFAIAMTVCLCLAASVAQAAHTQVQLISGADMAAPGSTVWVGVQLQMEPGWHTYWKNPGEAGEATAIKWQLPPGVTAGKIAWPLPEKIPPFDITTYGYEHEVVLLVPLTIAANVPAGPLDLQAKVTWLECNESCIPAGTTVQGTLNVGSPTTPSAAAQLLQAWLAKVPVSAANFSAQAWWDKPTDDKTRALNLEWAGSTNGADFFAYASDNFDIQGQTEFLDAPAGQIHLRKVVKKYSGDWPTNISGVFVSSDKSVTATVKITNEPVTPVSGTVASASTQSLWQMLVYAFIGGLILNIMPCVLPVIALKILGFVNEARSEPRRVRLLGLVYAFGVLVSFLALAAVIIGVKEAGHKAGWGMQFGNPVFLVCLTTLVTLVALNLFGVFEVVLGGRAISAAGELASKHGPAGAFFNGVLATALATPCTAPFLSIALGFAFAQSAGIILLVFAAVAAGLASPYVLLSWNPAWLKFLPKPGAWMEKFKIAMGFPMLLTAVWLFNLAAGNYGDGVIWLGIFLVAVAFAAWIFGEFVQRGSKRKGLAAVIALGLLVGAYAFALENQLHWRDPQTPHGNGQLAHEEGGIDWQPWSPATLKQALATGRPVLVDFTAKWCLTCQVNTKTSIEIPSVRGKLKAINAITLLADYTHFPDDITTELNLFKRAGVPLVLVYPKNADAQPIVLPEVLTPGIVLSALDRAAN